MPLALKHEFSKLNKSKAFRIAVLIAGLFAVVHFIYTISQVKMFYYDPLGKHPHPVGLDSISLLYRFLGCDDYSAVSTLFFLVLPILAALPYSVSLHLERKNGYQIHVISRVGKRQYLVAKAITAFVAGFFVVFFALVLDLMLCATICPLAKVHILSLQMSVYQGNFCYTWFYTHPIVFLIAATCMTSTWGGICAVMAMAVEIVIHNSVMITLAPCVFLFLISSVMEYLQGSVIQSVYVLKPNELFRAICLSRNPAWYIAVWQIGFLVASLALYFIGGMKRENL
ncbi:MAG: hypothetical protein ACI4S0_01590 [Dorea sp.]